MLLRVGLGEIVYNLRKIGYIWVRMRSVCFPDGICNFLSSGKLFWLHCEKSCRMSCDCAFF